MPHRQPLKRPVTVLLLSLLLAAAVAGGPLAASAQAQTFTIGVIGPVDGPTLQGVSLAVLEANERGLTLPNGTPFNLRVVAVDAGDQVGAAIDQLKQLGVVALFGPDEDTVAGANLATMSTSGVPIFTAATSTNVRAGGFIFRTRASDSARMAALSDVLTTDLGARRFAVYQGGEAGASPAAAFVGALAQRGIAANVVLQDPARAVSEAAAVVLQGTPEGVAAFGTPAQVAELYNALRMSGFSGVFATDIADNRAFIKAVAPSSRLNIYGVTGWTAASASPASVAFTRAYVTEFAEVPDSRSAAAFDGANLLIAAMTRTGADAASLLTGLLSTPAFTGLQGNYTPGVGELFSSAYVIQTNLNGAPTTYALFAGGSRQPLTAELIPTAVPTLAPSPTLVIPPTLAPTATPEGVVATVVSQVLNVRYGPGVVYDPPIGKLNKGDQVRLFGASPDYTWFTINYQGRQGWISGDPQYVSIFGDLRLLPIIPIPPTPTPAATATPTLAPFPDIVLVSAFLTPQVLLSGQPFTLTVTLKNQGPVDAGAYAVAAAFDPGGVFGGTTLPGLGAGQQMTVQINYPGVVGPGTYKIAIVLDLNSQLDEGPNGEANNKPEITYQVQ